MALTRCILGKFLGVVCHCLSLPLDVPTFSARCLHVPTNASAPSSERWNCGREWSGDFAEMTVFTPFTCRKSATWGKLIYFPFEGRHAEDFFARKILRLKQGANPRSWVPEASMLTTRPPKPLRIVYVQLKVQLDVLFMYSLFFFILSSTCFVCYLHLSSGAQLQRTVIGVCICGRQRL
jgi:hypothetical protein